GAREERGDRVLGLAPEGGDSAGDARDLGGARQGPDRAEEEDLAGEGPDERRERALAPGSDDLADKRRGLARLHEGERLDLRLDAPVVLDDDALALALIAALGGDRSGRRSHLAGFHAPDHCLFAS